MVLAAALISLAVLAPQAPAQAAPQAASQAKPQAERQPAPADDSKPYTVEGVRRAAAAGDQPPIDTAPVVPDRRGYRMAIDSCAGSTCVSLPLRIGHGVRPCGAAGPTRPGTNSSWP